MAQKAGAMHGRDHRPGPTSQNPDSSGGSDPIKMGLFEIKVTDDATVVVTGNGQFFMCVPDDLDGTRLWRAAAFVSTVSTAGTPTIRVRNDTQGVTMLTQSIFIDANENTSYTASLQPIINPLNSVVAAGDLIRIDVTAAGTGAKGLGVMLGFW